MRSHPVAAAISTGVVLAGVFGWAGSTLAGRGDLTLDQLPPAAKEALLKLANGATITEIESEKENGVVVYEAEWAVNGAEFEAEVTAEGLLVEFEEELTKDAAPAVVQAAIAKHFGADKAVEISRNTIVVYEIEGKVNGKSIEIIVHPTGKTMEDDDDDDDDQDE